MNFLSYKPTYIRECPFNTSKMVSKEEKAREKLPTGENMSLSQKSSSSCTETILNECSLLANTGNKGNNT